MVRLQSHCFLNLSVQSVIFKYAHIQIPFPVIRLTVISPNISSKSELILHLYTSYRENKSYLTLHSTLSCLLQFKINLFVIKPIRFLFLNFEKNHQNIFFNMLFYKKNLFYYYFLTKIITFTQKHLIFTLCI